MKCFLNPAAKVNVKAEIYPPPIVKISKHQSSSAFISVFEAARRDFAICHALFWKIAPGRRAMGSAAENVGRDFKGRGGK